MLLNCGVGEDSWESLGLQGDATSPFWRRSALGFLWKEWCWGWNSNTLANWCEELIHLKRPWCWERLRAGKGDDRGWDGWMASPTQWTWVWVNSRGWWWTGKPGMWGHKESDTTEWLTWTELKVKVTQSCPTLCNPMDYTVHGILQAGILEWVAFPFSRGSSQPRDRTQVSHTAGGFFTSWATREALPCFKPNFKSLVNSNLFFPWETLLSRLYSPLVQ